MALVALAIGGANYNVSCRDGEEPHLHTLADIVDAKVREVRLAVGGTSDVRQLLLAALLLADEVYEAKSGVPASGSDTPDYTVTIAALAEKIEAIATRLENIGVNP